MKQQGSELGSLASRFFAYTQLKKKEIVRTGELSPILEITPTQENDLLRRLSASGWIVRLKRGIYLVPPRLPAGGKYSPGIAFILQKMMSECKGSYQICGPTAFNFYGFEEQLTSITYVYNNAISGRKTIGSLTFQFIKIADQRLGGTQSFTTREGGKIIYSSKARTLMDSVYDWSRFNSLPKGYEWIRQKIGKDDRLLEDLSKAAVRYGNKATARRLGYLLDSMQKKQEIIEKLEVKIGKSKSLIPFIPNKPARGTINRRWGIIDNE